MRLLVRFQLMFQCKRPATSLFGAYKRFRPGRHMGEHHVIAQHVCFGERFRAMLALQSAFWTRRLEDAVNNREIVYGSRERQMTHFVYRYLIMYRLMPV